MVVWERTPVPKELEADFVEACKVGKLGTPSDIHDWLDEHGCDVEWETLYDAMDWMPPKDNQGYSTIEVVDYSTKRRGIYSSIVYSNGK